MRLPQQLATSLFFNFENIDDFIKALGSSASEEELVEIKNLSTLNLPPITSRHALATMFGVNPSLIWSFENRTRRYYRVFTISKGKKKRTITAPRVLLKIFQKWISIHLENSFTPFDHVYGFVVGKSHVDAANQHCGCKWMLSIDIKDFFPSTPKSIVQKSLTALGYSSKSAELISNLTTYNGYLAQGSPSSPVLSNICFNDADFKLIELATKHNARLTRYADDIVFSGDSDPPTGLKDELLDLFTNSPWEISKEKIVESVWPNRLKVHGLIVSGASPRLTKGYRNKIRAYKHLLQKAAIQDDNLQSIKGHIIYSNFIDSFS